MDARSTLDYTLELTDPKLDWALWYAAQGIPVFPLNGKAPLTPNGFKDATSDPAQIRAWWSQWPDANIGAPTGARTGFDVLDVDRKGEEALEALGIDYPDDMPIVRTGSGGLHFFFAHEDGVTNSSGSLPHGVDVRGEGGYVVLPPSIHASGGLYAWMIPLAGEFPMWTDKLRSMIRTSPNGKHHEPISEDIPEGARNTTFASYAGALRRVGAPQSHIEVALLGINAAQASPLSQQEVSRVAKSISRYAPAARSIASPAFPLDALPASVRSFVEAAAASIGCPPEFVAVPLLTLAGAVIGNSQALELKPGYREYPVLWTGVVAPPGTAKSPALGYALAPLKELQKVATAMYEGARAAKRENPDHVVEPLEHYFTTDTTPEALAQILASSAGVAIVRDEIVGWVNSFGQYKGKIGDERQRMLSSWSSGDWKIDRKKADPIHISLPVMPVTGGIQPEKLSDLAPEAGHGDGFIERFLFAYPVSNAETWVEQGVEQEQFRAILDVFRHLRRHAVNVRPEPPYGVHRLSEAAEGVWIERFNTWKAQARAANGLSAGMLNKASSHLARLTLIIHCLTPGAESKVSETTITNAAKLMDYFLAHGERVLNEIDPVRKRQHVLDAISNRGDWVSKTDIVDQLNRHVYGKELGEILEELRDAGLIEYQSVSTGGRRRDEYRAIQS